MKKKSLLSSQFGRLSVSSFWGGKSFCDGPSADRSHGKAGEKHSRLRLPALITACPVSILSEGFASSNLTLFPYPMIIKGSTVLTMTTLKIDTWGDTEAIPKLAM